MGIKNDNDLKYCLTCEFHFYAEPEVHEETYHEDGQWMYIFGSARSTPFEK